MRQQPAVIAALNLDDEVSAGFLTSENIATGAGG
jgi:hypothetical protein